MVSLRWLVRQLNMMVDYSCALTGENIDQEITSRLAKSLNDRGLSFVRTSSYLQALASFKEAFSLFEKIKSKENMAAQLGNIGSVHRDMGGDADAINSYSAALALFKEIGAQESIADQLTNIAYIHSMNGRDRLALELYEKGELLYQTLSSTHKAEFAAKNVARLTAILATKPA